MLLLYSEGFSLYSLVCCSSTVSSRDVVKARQASRCSDVEVTLGKTADTVDEPPSITKTAATPADASSASESITRLKMEFLSGSPAEERYEVQTSVASTMTPLRCVSVTTVWLCK